MDIKKPDMGTIKFQLRTQLIAGKGELSNLKDYLEGYKNIFLVVDKNVLHSTYGKKINDVYNINHNVIDTFEYSFGEPTYQLLEKHRIRDFDCVIGIGGGSVIDFAKGLAFLATNPYPAVSYKGFPSNINQPLPIIAIPTTAGTGSEVTYNAVFIDNKKKLGINTTACFPKTAILDPCLIQSCPRDVMVSAGMDALTHAIESYGAKQSNSLSCMFSTKALDILLHNLQYITDNTSLDVCSSLQLGAYLAGIGLMNSGSGPSGALSYILGPNYNVPHGLAGAVFLPHIVEFNEKHCFRYKQEGLSLKIIKLCEQFKIPYTNLSSLVKNPERLYKGIRTLQPAFNQNPIVFTVNDAKKIIKNML